MSSKLTELLAQFDQIISGRGQDFLDAGLPPLVFLVANNYFPLYKALISAVLISLVLVALRIKAGGGRIYLAAGFFGTLVAAGLSLLSGEASAFFLPGIATNLLLFLACVISLFLRTPLVAVTSSLIRGWPLDWFRHPKVLPAYNQVTLIWAGAFLLRFVLEYQLFQVGNAAALGLFQVVLGLPFMISLLVISYLYGQFRLHKLSGPSVEEFERGAEPPWESQRTGF